MQYLKHEEAFHLALCLVSGYVQYSDKKSSKLETAFYYRTIFHTAIKLSPGLFVPGFCYLPGRGSFAWGSKERNQYGQLGLGHKTDQATPKLILGLQRKKIIAIAREAPFTIVLTALGEVYSWGINSSGTLGLGNHVDKATPQLITAFKSKKITSIATGPDFALALTDTGNIYSWGYNGEGRLGLGIEMNSQVVSKYTPQFIKALESKKIIAIAAGFNFALALTDTGNVYAWGCNNNGQLGLGDTDYRTTPQLINALCGKKIIAIAAGFRPRIGFN